MTTEEIAKFVDAGILFALKNYQDILLTDDGSIRFLTSNADHNYYNTLTTLLHRKDYPECK